MTAAPTIPRPDLDLDALRIEFDVRRKTLRYAYELGDVGALGLWAGIKAIDELEREAGLLPD